MDPHTIARELRRIGVNGIYDLATDTINVWGEERAFYVPLFDLRNDSAAGDPKAMARFIVYLMGRELFHGEKAFPLA